MCRAGICRIRAGRVLARWQTAGLILLRRRHTRFTTSSSASSRKPSKVSGGGFFRWRSRPTEKSWSLVAPRQAGRSSGIWKMLQSVLRFRRSPATASSASPIRPTASCWPPAPTTDFCCIRRADTGSVLQTFERIGESSLKHLFARRQAAGHRWRGRTGKAVGRGDRQTGANL